MTQVLEGALEGYKDLVERNFPNFGSALGRYAIWPIRITGVLTIPPDEKLRGRIMDDPQPVLSYFLTHDSQSLNESSVDIQLATMADLGLDEDTVFGLLSRSARHGGPFVRLTSHYEVLRLAERPATEYAYNWLKEDLAEVGLH